MKMVVLCWSCWNWQKPMPVDVLLAAPWALQIFHAMSKDILGLVTVRSVFIVSPCAGSEAGFTWPWSVSCAWLWVRSHISRLEINSFVCCYVDLVGRLPVFFQSIDHFLISEDTTQKLEQFGERHKGCLTLCKFRVILVKELQFVKHWSERINQGALNQAALVKGQENNNWISSSSTPHLEQIVFICIYLPALAPVGIALHKNH
jgi:hypothetical protein